MNQLFSDILLPVQRRPLLCLTLLWVAGLLVAVHLPIPWFAWTVAGGIFLLVWGITIFSSRRVGYIALALAAASLSAGYNAWRLAPPSTGDLDYLPAGGVAIKGFARRTPVVYVKNWRTTFHVTDIREGKKWRPIKADVDLLGEGSPPIPGSYYQIQGLIEIPNEPGNPFDIDWKSYLAQRGIVYRLNALEVAQLNIPAPKPLLGGVRAYCGSALLKAMPGTYRSLYAQILESLVLGVYGSPLPDQLVEQFRAAGTIHLMVVSGSQVALLGSIFLLPLLLLPFGGARSSYPRLRLILLMLSLPVLALYVVLADGGPSVNRALIMVLLTVMALFLVLSPMGRLRSYRPDGLTIISAAGMVILISQPSMLFSPGMQLSFSAVLGLSTITPVFMRLWHRLPSLLSLTMSATFAAQLMTFPVLAWHFGTLPVLAFFTNLIAVPAVGLLLPLGLLTLIVALIAPPAATVFAALCIPLLNLLLFANNLAANFKFVQISFFTRSLWLVFVYFAIVALGIRFLSCRIDSRKLGWEVMTGKEPQMW